MQIVPPMLSFLLRNGNLFFIGFTNPKPPSNDQNRQRADYNTGVVHALNRDRLGVRKAEENNGEGEPADGHAIDQPTPFPHVESPFVHVSSPSEHIGEDRNVVCDVIDGDCRAKHGVEGGGAAEVDASKRSVRGRHEQLGIERYAKPRAHAGPCLRPRHCSVSCESPQHSRGRELGRNDAWAQRYEEDEGQPKSTPG